MELLRRGGCFDYPGMAAVKADAKFAALRTFPEFPALEEPPPDPVDRCPARFTFDYPHDDPGKRVWRRDGRVWREVQPSGKTNCFDTGGRIRVRGISGTEITGRADNRIRFFIPDLATGASPRLMISQAGGEWSFVGILTDME